MKRWRSKILAVMVLMVFAAVALTGCGTAQKSDKSPENKTAQKIKVGFIYVGPVGDGGFTYSHDQGRKYLEQKLSYVETVYNENVNDVDTERVASQLAEQGCKVIFATSFGEMDGMLAAAKKYPNVVFMHCSGYKTYKNMGTYFGREYQGRYLTGLIAGKMTKSNKIGYVAAFPIPECVRGINAFTLGVRAVNPKATVKVVWTNSWVNPAAEKQAAESLLDYGADVLTQHQDSPATQQAAQERGVYAIGYNTDMHKFAPEANLTSVIWDWGPYYVKVLESVKNGTWTSGQYWGPMADGIVQLAPISDKVPADVKKLVEDKKQEILSKKFDVFEGPIKDQAGKLRVHQGQIMPDQDKLNLDWFVEGVEGTIPKT
jgi:basic membrane protein A